MSSMLWICRIEWSRSCQNPWTCWSFSPNFLSLACGLLLSADTAPKYLAAFNSLWNAKASFLYKTSAGKFEPTYWQEIKRKWPAWDCQTFPQYQVTYNYCGKSKSMLLPLKVHTILYYEFLILFFSVRKKRRLTKMNQVHEYRNTCQTLKN